ncbi:DUF1857 family protein [Geomonas sp. Red32]|uniref:DUF302 domain-containing protein n=1 Tax=Geomonas sp. Red32 TaxID=2912856 RepID=UPI00202CB57C|nr:DUF302 domain-containing protein [Geomonas sp. Red32]MCM0081569.1 DUF1857 family protein [Geomonas sp. Red32]
MRKVTYSCEIHAALDTVWKLLIEKVEQPQSYMPGVIQSRILQHYGNGLLREIKGEGMLIKEKVVIDRGHGEIHYFLLEHPLFSGKVVNRVVPSSVQNPVSPQVLTIEVDWAPKDEKAEQILLAGMANQIQSEALAIKQRAETLDKENSQPLSTPYAFGITVALPFADAVKKVREELAKEGFGIISEADVKQKFQEKLQKDFRDYLILGACNPGAAYQALGIEMNIGTLLPCNVVLYSVSEIRTVVMVMDPVAALSLVGNPHLVELAESIKESLQRVVAGL